jgi:hypothetical protein
MVERCIRWAAPAVRSFMLCWLGGLVIASVAVAQTSGPAGPTAYRCGNSYSSTPCSGGSAVATDDARSAAQQREAQDVKRRDAALADQMAADRRARERATVAQPAIGIAPPAAASAPKRDPASTTSTKKKKKTATKKPVTTTPKKLSSAG